MPGVSPGALSKVWVVARALVVLDQAEVQHLDEVVLEAEPAQVDVGGLDVAMDQPGVVRLRERVAGLPQEVHHPAGRQRAVAAHQGLEVDARRAAP